MKLPKAGRAFAVTALSAVMFALPTATALASEPSPSAGSPGAAGELDDRQVTAHAEEWRDHRPSTSQKTAPKDTSAWSPSSGGSETPPKVKKARQHVDRDVDVKTEGCTDMSLQQCVSARTACMTSAGGPNGFKPPTITWVRVDGGEWQYRGLSCGPPTTVTLPGGAGGSVVQVQAPPVPTLGQIQSAFRALPFSKPTASIQPAGNRTAINLKTYYAASWPDDDGLQPGEISTPVKLLSWTIEFKVAARDYRYTYGDGTTSGWTTSTGGTHPDGDITHTYSETGDVEVSIDARLTGQYRVNGGAWQDIATTADLQDEPSTTLQVLGTKTSLVSN